MRNAFSLYTFISNILISLNVLLGTAGPKIKTQARPQSQSDSSDENDGLLTKIKKALFG